MAQSPQSRNFPSRFDSLSVSAMHRTGMDSLRIRPTLDCPIQEVDEHRRDSLALSSTLVYRRARSFSSASCVWNTDMKAAALEKNEIASFPDEKTDSPRWLSPPLATVAVLHCLEAQSM